MKKPLNYLLVLTLSLSFIACTKDKGEAAKTSEAEKVEQVAEAATYKVNSGASKVMWEGYKPTGTHNGTVNISEGSVEVKDEKVVGGEFTMNMNSITVLDQTGESKMKLEAHLKGTAAEQTDDFFNVKQFPTSKFEITKVVDLKGDPDANAMVYGNLTMKDKTNNVGFKANISISGNSVEVKTPKFNIDRTKWSVHYGSKSIFDNLGDNFINDELGLNITLAANK